MRYIDINNLQLPDGWLEKAESLTQRLNNATDEASRNQIIEDNPIWQELVVPLSRLSHQKCWYSEAKEIMSDRDVDHFRPKKKALNVEKIQRASEEGYWWLAFDWENYRFSSIYSNRRRRDKFVDEEKTGGKWCYFPLFEQSIVATSKRRCQDEDIILLDPCDDDDPPLLTFDKKGVAIPNASAILNNRDKKRVEVSINLYHLDHEPLREAREQIWDKCERHINEIRNIANDEDLSVTDRVRIRFLRSEIRKMMIKSEELSAVAIACCEENGLISITPPR